MVDAYVKCHHHLLIGCWTSWSDSALGRVRFKATLVQVYMIKCCEFLLLLFHKPEDSHIWTPCSASYECNVHPSPGATVEVVEIDNKVIEAAIESMGFPPCQTPCHSKVASGIWGPTEEFQMDGIESGVQPLKAKEERGRETNGFEEVIWGSILRRMTVYKGDGEAYVLDMQRREAQMKQSHRKFYDLVFVDAYDGDDIIPTKFYSRKGPFLTSLNQLLDPEHGTVVVCSTIIHTGLCFLSKLRLTSKNPCMYSLLAPFTDSPLWRCSLAIELEFSFDTYNAPYIL